MHRPLIHPGKLWIAGILSAVFFCLVVVLGGSGGWRPVTQNVAPSVHHSGGMDVSHQPSARFLVNPNRYAVLSASKVDKALGLDPGGGPGPAILPDGIALPGNVAAKPFVTVVPRAPDGNGASGYNARAPPTLI